MNRRPCWHTELMCNIQISVNLFGDITFFLFQLFLLSCEFSVEGSDTAVLFAVSLWFLVGICWGFPFKYCTLYLYAHTHTHTDAHKNIYIAFGTLDWGEGPLVVRFRWLFSNRRWEMLLFLLTAGAAVQICCFVLWIHLGSISLSCTMFFLWYYWLWFCLTFVCTSFSFFGQF